MSIPQHYTPLLPQEYYAFIGLTDGAFRLYVWLRQFMHRKDGEAFGSGVTWNEIASTGLYVEAGRGIVDSGMRDKRAMTRYRDELVRKGLLEDIGDKKTFLRFRFPIFIAHWQASDNFTQNKPAPMSHPNQDLNSHLNTTDNTSTYEDMDSNPASPESTIPAPSPISHTNNKQQQAFDFFAMHSEWTPSEQGKTILQSSGFDVEGKDAAHYLAALAEFRMFWQLPETHRDYGNKVLKSQLAWERELLMSMTRRDQSIASTSKPKTSNKPDLKLVSNNAVPAPKQESSRKDILANALKGYQYQAKLQGYEKIRDWAMAVGDETAINALNEYNNLVRLSA